MHHSSHLQNRKKKKKEKKNVKVKHVDLTIKSQIPYNCVCETDHEKAISICRPVSLTWACVLEGHQPTSASNEELRHSSELRKVSKTQLRGMPQTYEASESCFYYNFYYLFIALSTHFQVAQCFFFLYLSRSTRTKVVNTQPLLYSPYLITIYKSSYKILLLFSACPVHDYREELFKHGLTALQTQPVIFYEAS